MRFRVRGRIRLVRDWMHGQDLLGPNVPRVARASEVAEAAQGLARRLGLDSEIAWEPGDLLAVGRGFAAGTRTDHAALVLVLGGVRAVLARSAEPGFVASADRLGLPVLAWPQAMTDLQDGDEVILDAETGTIENLRTRRMGLADAPSTERVARWLEAPGKRALGLEADSDGDVVEIPPNPPAHGRD